MKSKIVTMFIMVFGFVLLSALSVTATDTGSHPPVHLPPSDGCEVFIIDADCTCITLGVRGCDHSELTIDYALTITEETCDSEDFAGGMFIRGSATVNEFQPTIVCYEQHCVDGGCSIAEYLQSGDTFVPSGIATIRGNDGTILHCVVVVNDHGVITPCGPPDEPQGLCDKSNPDKPKVQIVTLEYLGGVCVAGCENDGNTQDNTNNDPNKHKVQCDNFAAGPFDETVYMIATDKKDPFDSKANTWFSGEVSVGDEFDINAMDGGKTKLGANTYICIFDKDPATPGATTFLQKLLFHTSCSQPLVVGNVFCIVEVKGIVLE